MLILFSVYYSSISVRLRKNLKKEWRLMAKTRRNWCKENCPWCISPENARLPSLRKAYFRIAFSFPTHQPVTRDKFPAYQFLSFNVIQSPSSRWRTGKSSRQQFWWFCQLQPKLLIELPVLFRVKLELFLSYWCCFWSGICFIFFFYSFCFPSRVDFFS